MTILIESRKVIVSELREILALLIKLTTMLMRFSKDRRIPELCAEIAEKATLMERFSERMLEKEAQIEDRFPSRFSMKQVNIQKSQLVLTDIIVFLSCYGMKVRGSILDYNLASMRNHPNRLPRWIAKGHYAIHLGFYHGGAAVIALPVVNEHTKRSFLQDWRAPDEGVYFVQAPLQQIARAHNIVYGKKSRAKPKGPVRHLALKDIDKHLGG